MIQSVFRVTGSQVPDILIKALVMPSLLRRVYNRLPPALAGVAGSIRYCGLPVPIKTARANSLLSYINLFFLQELARRADVLNLRGDFVECGVYRGGSAGVLGYQAMHSPFPRRLWLYDAFAGMPKATEEDDDYSRSLENTFVGSESQTRQILHHLRVPETRYTIVRGWFEDTLPKATPGPDAGEAGAENLGAHPAGTDA